MQTLPQKELCDCWHPPACQHHMSESDANLSKNAYSGTLWLTVSRAKSEEKWWKRICCFIEEFKALGLRIRGYRAAENPSRFHGRGQNSWDRSVHVSKSTVHHFNSRERKGPSKRVIQKCEPHEHTSYPPKI